MDPIVPPNPNDGDTSAETTCYVYQYYDADGELLYVGMSYQPLIRFKQGHSDKSWRYQVATIDVAEYPSRDLAEQAEAEAILSEEPRHNIKIPKEAASLVGSDPKPRSKSASPPNPERNAEYQRAWRERQATAEGRTYTRRTGPPEHGTDRGVRAHENRSWGWGSIAEDDCELCREQRRVLGKAKREKRRERSTTE